MGAASTEGGIARAIVVENPATGEPIRSVEVASAERVGATVARARAVQPLWEAMGYAGRARVLRRAQRWMIDNAERVIETIVAETGKTYEDALVAEVGYAANALGFWAKHAPRYLADQRIRSRSPLALGKRLVVRYAPVGVVGVIGPWNFPLTNSFGDCIPALAAGNAVVLKPSEVTPLTSLLMAEAMLECGLPEDVFAVLTGDGETGAALIEHVDFVMFTGSTRTGRRVLARAAERLTPVSLELGGKDPMIVLADADIERAARAASFYAMNNAGQACISIERVYVEEPVYDEFVAHVTRQVGELRQGEPTGPGTVDVGAVIFAPQLELIESHVADALARGATVALGGHRGEGPGRFFEPTVLLDVDHTMAAMTAETFGPTLPIMKVRDAEEAIRLANSSPYGLQASVWTKDVDTGEAIAREIHAGVVCVNDAQVNYTALDLPMGGWKSSGLGTRHAAGGIRKYARQQTLLVTRRARGRRLHTFPYTPLGARMLRLAFKLLYGRGRRH